jgi:hypothetical protein
MSEMETAERDDGGVEDLDGRRDGDVEDLGVGRLSLERGPLSRRGMALVALVALVPVVSAIGIAVLLSLGTGQPATGNDAGSPVVVGGNSSGSGDPGADPGSSDPRTSGAPSGSGLRESDPDDAAKALRDAGIRRVGNVVAAWTWRDGNTDTMVAVTRRVTKRNSNFSARAVTLRVTTLADPSGDPTSLATADDDGQTCAKGTELKTGFAADDVSVRDLDGDGVREVLVAWSHGCGSDVRRRATVLAGSAVYALDGQGSLVAEPDPPLSDWPDGYVDAATAALDAAG